MTDKQARADIKKLQERINNVYNPVFFRFNGDGADPYKKVEDAGLDLGEVVNLLCKHLGIEIEQVLRPAGKFSLHTKDTK